jgi:uncharacterized membrane protein
MLLKICELISIIFSALVGGMYWGPWLALTRSFPSFEPSLFLATVRALNRNMGPVMTVLTPVGLLSIVPVLFISYAMRPVTFYLGLVGFALFVTALIVTMIVEVPIVRQILTWTDSTLPENWKKLRDRWGAFHIIRVAAGFAGLILLVVGALY